MSPEGSTKMMAKKNRHRTSMLLIGHAMGSMCHCIICLVCVFVCYENVELVKQTNITRSESLVLLNLKVAFAWLWLGRGDDATP
jgi:ferredoxin